MSRNLDDLQPDFRAAVDLVLADCRELGVEMRPFFTTRSPAEQARLWRQSRTWAQIQAAIEAMRNQGAPWLASVLYDVGPQHGKHATGALPGRSWHQWGLAVDCFLVGPQGEALWDSLEPGYDVYAQAVLKRGLHLGPTWDRVHIQARPGSVSMPWAVVEEAMQTRWGG